MVRAGGLKSLPAFLGRLLRLSDTAVRAALLHECLQSFSAVQTNSLVIVCGPFHTLALFHLWLYHRFFHGVLSMVCLRAARVS